MTDPNVNTGTPPEGGGNPNPNPNPQPAWYDGFKNTEVKGWVESYKGAYPTAEAMAEKAYNLEKFVGADKAGRGIVLPKDGAKLEELVPIFRRLGAPEKIDGYKVDEKVANDPTITKLREHALKIGMPVQHFDATVQFLAEVGKTSAAAKDAALTAQAEKDLAELDAEWAGEEYDKNIELGRRAARAFLPHDASDPKGLEKAMHNIEAVLGTKATLKMWAAIGGGLAEGTFIDGQGGGPGGGAMTPEAARVKIAELKRDTEWVKRYNAGGAEEKAEFEKLHKIAAVRQ